MVLEQEVVDNINVEYKIHQYYLIANVGQEVHHEGPQAYSSVKTQNSLQNQKMQYFGQDVSKMMKSLYNYKNQTLLHYLKPIHNVEYFHIRDEVESPSHNNKQPLYLL